MNLREELLNFKKIYKQMVQQKGINTKVKSVQANGIWENTYQNACDLGGGKKGYFKFDYEMEDGVALSVNHTHKDPFPIGAEVSYKITRSNDYGNSGTVGKPEQTVGEYYTEKKYEPMTTITNTPQIEHKISDTQTQIIRQSSLTRAVEVLSHNKADFQKEEVLILADYFVQFVLTGKR